MHEGGSTDTSDLFGMGCLWFSRALVRCCISPYGRPWEAKNHLARGAVEQAVGPMFELGCSLASPRSAEALLGRCVLARSNSFAEESAMCPLEGEWALAWSIGPLRMLKAHSSTKLDPFSLMTCTHTGLGRAAAKQCADSERSWNGSAIMCSSEMGFFRKWELNEFQQKVRFLAILCDLFGMVKWPYLRG